MQKNWNLKHPLHPFMRRHVVKKTLQRMGQSSIIMLKVKGVYMFKLNV